jgi:hypothetical protein
MRKVQRARQCLLVANLLRERWWWMCLRTGRSVECSAEYSEQSVSRSLLSSELRLSVADWKTSLWLIDAWAILEITREAEWSLFGAASNRGELGANPVNCLGGLCFTQGRRKNINPKDALKQRTDHSLNRFQPMKGHLFARCEGPNAHPAKADLTFGRRDCQRLTLEQVPDVFWRGRNCPTTSRRCRNSKAVIEDQKIVTSLLNTHR